MDQASPHFQNISAREPSQPVVPFVPGSKQVRCSKICRNNDKLRRTKRFQCYADCLLGSRRYWRVGEPKVENRQHVREFYRERQAIPLPKIAVHQPLLLYAPYELKATPSLDTLLPCMASISFQRVCSHNQLWHATFMSMYACIFLATVESTFCLFQLSFLSTVF